MKDIEIKELDGGVGVEIHGVDIKKLSNSQFSSIRDAFVKYGLIFFREQSITPDQHIEFAERWGEININRFFAKVEGYEKIAEVLKEEDQELNIGGAWHTDHSYDDVPAMGSILVAKEVPDQGGDTLFANMYKAYEDLSDGFKETLSNLKAIHSSRHVFGEQSSYGEQTNNQIRNPELATQDAIHPVIITHPESGKKALYVNPSFTIGIEGWSKEESRALLDFLYSQAVSEENITRFKWKKDSIAFWDNRCTWHYALNDYPGKRRLMHRITVEGSKIS